MQKVLALFANPSYTNQLRLGAEDRTIRECFRRGKMRDSIELVVRHAATVDDVRRALLDDEFTIVHFSGHGTRAADLRTKDRALVTRPRRGANARAPVARHRPPARSA